MLLLLFCITVRVSVVLRGVVERRTIVVAGECLRFAWTILCLVLCRTSCRPVRRNCVKKASVRYEDIVSISR